jgi:hypothetical protein
MILILSFALSLQQNPPLLPFVLWTARLWVGAVMPQLDQGALASKLWNDAEQQHWPFPLSYSYIHTYIHLHLNKRFTLYPCTSNSEFYWLVR